MDSFKRIDILGCPFDAASFEETVRCIQEAICGGTRLHIVTGNIDFVMKARRDPEYARQLWQADLVVADGVPIVWAATLLGEPLRGRVNGTDLVWSCSEISAKTGKGIALVGGMEGVAVRAAEKMRAAHPGARLFPIATPFPLGPEESEQVVRDIRAVNARILLVALGAPRQENWIRDYLEPCGANVGIGIGSAFDLISGDKSRAPRWMRDNGLEWFHRMLQEPGRLGKRYLVEDAPFLFHLAAAVIGRRRSQGAAGKQA